MKQLTKIMMAICLFTVTAVFAQTKDYSAEPGYVEFGNLNQFEDGEAATEIYVEENLLKMVAKLAQKDEPEVAAMINGLKLVKVNSYEITDANKSSLAKKMEEINKKLEGKSWQRIVRRTSSKDNAYVYVKAGGSDKFVGLVVLAMSEAGEATFVNIVGDIDLETIGSLSDKFDIPALDDVHKKSGEKEEE